MLQVYQILFAKIWQHFVTVMLCRDLDMPTTDAASVGANVFMDLFIDEAPSSTRSGPSGRVSKIPSTSGGFLRFLAPLGGF